MKMTEAKTGKEGADIVTGQNTTGCFGYIDAAGRIMVFVDETKDHWGCVLAGLV